MTVKSPEPDGAASTAPSAKKVKLPPLSLEGRRIAKRRLAKIKRDAAREAEEAAALRAFLKETTTLAKTEEDRQKLRDHLKFVIGGCFLDDVIQNPTHRLHVGTMAFLAGKVTIAKDRADLGLSPRAASGDVAGQDTTISQPAVETVSQPASQAISPRVTEPFIVSRPQAQTVVRTLPPQDKPASQTVSQAASVARSDPATAMRHPSAEIDETPVHLRRDPPPPIPAPVIPNLPADQRNDRPPSTATPATRPATRSDQLSSYPPPRTTGFRLGNPINSPARRASVDTDRREQDRPPEEPILADEFTSSKQPAPSGQSDDFRRRMQRAALEKRVADGGPIIKS